MLSPLQVNPYLVLKKQQFGLKTHGPDTIRVNTANSTEIIVEDFAYNTNGLNPEYWLDHHVYVNRTMAREPVSLGVATFDGLNEKGYPYNFTLNSSYGACDTLTSQPIELGNVDPSQPLVDSIFLNFHVQPQGMNPNPNSSKDSLTLQFKDLVLDSTWVIDTSGNGFWDYFYKSSWRSVWSREGSASIDFIEVIVKVPYNMYYNGFQFRFISYGNTSGSIDHWHLDNVLLTANGRSFHNKVTDVAFQMPTQSLIKDYEAMPWFHYYDDPLSFTRTAKIGTRINNTHSDRLQMRYEYRAFDVGGSEVDLIDKDSAGGFPIQANLSNQRVDVPNRDPYKFSFPTAGLPKNTTTYFRRETSLYSPDIPAEDVFSSSDIIREYQVFGTYYAYDDGTAEAGYGIKAQGGSVAMRYALPDGVSDYITSFYMHFNPVVEDRSSEKVRLTIWADSDNDSFPDDIIYENAVVTSPIYPKEESDAVMGVNAFQRIFLEDSVEVSGTYFIGYQKITSEVINLGFDLNKNNQDKLYVDIGGGWQISVISGTVMMRPSFSSMSDTKVGIDQRPNAKNFDWNVYPNPTSGNLYIDLNDQGVWNLDVYCLDGSNVHRANIQERYSINTQGFGPGIYMIMLTNDSGERHSKKIIVSN